MSGEEEVEQLIDQSAKATADELTDVLASQSALIALPTYYWNEF